MPSRPRNRHSKNPVVFHSLGDKKTGPKNTAKKAIFKADIGGKLQVKLLEKATKVKAKTLAKQTARKARMAIEVRKQRRIKRQALKQSNKGGALIGNPSIKCTSSPFTRLRIGLDKPGNSRQIARSDKKQAVRLPPDDSKRHKVGDSIGRDIGRNIEDHVVSSDDSNREVDRNHLSALEIDDNGMGNEKIMRIKSSGNENQNHTNDRRKSTSRQKKCSNIPDTTAQKIPTSEKVDFLQDDSNENPDENINFSSPEKSGSVRGRKSNVRVSAYNPKKHPKAAYLLCSKYGADNKQLTTAFSISTFALYSWMRRNPEFKEAIVSGKDEFDSEHVEKKLLQRAIGFTYTEVRTEKVILKNSKNNKNISVPGTKITRTVKTEKPDVLAQIFYLKNRQPLRWKDVYKNESTINQSITHKGEIKIDDCTDRAEKVATILYKAGALDGRGSSGPKAKVN